MTQETLEKLDIQHIWHPCTQMKDHETLPLIPIQKAKGVYLYDFHGKSYIDCISSWWVNLFGHCNDYINQAINLQLQNLEHVLLAGFTHEPIIKLSERLCKLLPQNLQKCFYADNGSSAIEIALKMSFHYFLNHNKKRDLFLSLSNAYHGETIAALSVGDIALYRQTYHDLLLRCLHTEVPKNTQDFEKELESLKKILNKNGHRISAFILEPLIQCAGNMNMYSKEYIQEATNLCREYEIQIIFDEIAVGFGRTGSMFALEQCNVSPDYLCLSKGITGGYMPLSVVITTDEIYRAFYAPYQEQKAFLHSHSYTGNTLACVAANAVLDIFENEQIIQKNQALSAFIAQKFQNLQNNPKIANMRYCGMVFAFEVVQTKRERIGLFIFTEGLKRGLLLRPLGNTIYFMPPYIITHEQVNYVVENLEIILQQI